MHYNTGRKNILRLTPHTAEQCWTFRWSFGIPKEAFSVAGYQNVRACRINIFCKMPRPIYLLKMIQDDDDDVESTFLSGVENGKICQLEVDVFVWYFYVRSRCRWSLLSPSEFSAMEENHGRNGPDGKARDEILVGDHQAYPYRSLAFVGVGAGVLFKETPGRKWKELTCQAAGEERAVFGFDNHRPVELLRRAAGYIRIWLLNEQRVSFMRRIDRLRSYTSSRGVSPVHTFHSCPKHHHPHFSNISLRTASTSISQYLQRSRHITSPQRAQSNPWWYDRMLLLSPWTHKRKHESCSGYHPKRVFVGLCFMMQTTAARIMVSPLLCSKTARYWPMRWENWLPVAWFAAYQFHASAFWQNVHRRYGISTLSIKLGRYCIIAYWLAPTPFAWWRYSNSSATLFATTTMAIRPPVPLPSLISGIAPIELSQALPKR